MDKPSRVSPSPTCASGHGRKSVWAICLAPWARPAATSKPTVASPGPSSRGEAARRPGFACNRERRRRHARAAELAELFAPRSSASFVTYAPAGPTPSSHGAHHSSKLANSTPTESDDSRIVLEPRLPKQGAEPRPRARADELRFVLGCPDRTPRALTRTVTTATCPRSSPHTHAATAPDCRVTRAISRSPATASVMKWTTS